MTPAAEQLVSIPKKEYDKLISDHQYLKEQLAELKRLIYGSKSEKFIPSNSEQLGLFTLEGKGQEAEAETETITYTRTKSGKKKQIPVRALLPAHLPRVEEVIEPEGLVEGSKKIGEEVTEILEYNPANIFVRRIVRPKYAKPGNSGVVIAELPSLPIPKGNAGASVLAHILVSKFIDHLPFYRQRQIFKRQKLEISDSTLGSWFNASQLSVASSLRSIHVGILPVLNSTDSLSTIIGYFFIIHSGTPIPTRDQVKVRAIT
ncbi:MAG: transposase [Flavobacteriales bacterium]|nr:transposase [Flavobacteriales bacterium]